MSDETKPQEASSDAEPSMLPEAITVPAVFGNIVNLAISPGGARLTFGEKMNDQPVQWRMAVVLPFGVAISLRDIIQKMIIDNPNVEIQIIEGEKPDGQE
ncbi:MAG: hypothetical protein PVI23_07230 [Maricaulaceae bacterium]|jgi:hypothetical protein